VELPLTTARDTKPERVPIIFPFQENESRPKSIPVNRTASNSTPLIDGRIIFGVSNCTLDKEVFPSIGNQITQAIKKTKICRIKLKYKILILNECIHRSIDAKDSNCFCGRFEINNGKEPVWD
jgi:hypothetical protein